MVNSQPQIPGPQQNAHIRLGEKAGEGRGRQQEEEKEKKTRQRVEARQQACDSEVVLLLRALLFKWGPHTRGYHEHPFM